MTSNLCSEILLEAKELNKKIEDQVMEIVRKAFRPEFLNRIDSIVFFRRLTEEDVKHIARIQLHEVEKRLAQRGVMLEIQDDVFEYIAELGYVKEFGARPLKRAIQDSIMAPLAQYLLQHPDTKKITLVMKKGCIVIE